MSIGLIEIIHIPVYINNIDASLFNLNENGIYIIPTGSQNVSAKAYPDLCSEIPAKSIKDICFYHASLSPQKQDDMELCIDYDEYTWDTHDRGTKPLFDLTMAFHVQRRIDGAPFHEYNVNKSKHTPRLPAAADGSVGALVYPLFQRLSLYINKSDDLLFHINNRADVPCPAPAREQWSHGPRARLDEKRSLIMRCAMLFSFHFTFHTSHLLLQSHDIYLPFRFPLFSQMCYFTAGASISAIA